MCGAGDGIGLDETPTSRGLPLGGLAGSASQGFNDFGNGCSSSGCTWPTPCTKASHDFVRGREVAVVVLGGGLGHLPRWGDSKGEGCRCGTGWGSKQSPLSPSRESGGASRPRVPEVEGIRCRKDAASRRPLHVRPDVLQVCLHCLHLFILKTQPPLTILLPSL